MAIERSPQQQDIKLGRSYGLTRRHLLHSSAVLASAAVLASCSGGNEPGSQPGSGNEPASNAKASHTEPLKPPAAFGESPLLAAEVEAGNLPPVGERLPDNPYVVPHKWLEVGKYGGSLRMVMGATDPQYAIKENMYGHSILRFLNDGLDIGPGLAESWESTPDAQVWTFHFRKGLKWSDGEPWSTADILYWWEDMVQNEVHPEIPPDDVRSGRDTTAKLTAPDDHTLVLAFDAPAPATAERLAAWTNRGNGPRWMEPKHYLQQFHPKYNSQVKADNWYEKHDEMSDWALNPECPTMCGWRLLEYSEGRAAIYERNPYYWCVDTEGNQLPYIDELNFELIDDDQVQKLKLIEGAADYVHGGHTPLILADVPALRDAEENTGVEMFFWDSGTGTGSILFWNQDYPDAAVREIIRNKKFRQALSYAYNREEVRKAIYFNSGELTTGTLSPKGVIFAGSAEGKTRYQEWRDSYVKYDPELAKQMLDELGIKDNDGDGKRELPNGEPLVMYLDFPADTNEEHLEKNEHVRRSWEAVGITTRLNPIPPDTYDERWDRGEFMIKCAWEVGDNHPLLYPGWVIPVEPAHWAPLHGKAFQLQTADPDIFDEQANVSPWERTPPWILPESGDEPIARLWDLYARARVEADAVKRTELLWQVVKIHVEEGPYFLGSVANTPRIVMAHADLRNVPRRENLALGGWTNPWILPSPAVYDPEAYFWSNPEEHTAP